MADINMLENYLDLVNAVIEKAANDYRLEHRRLKKQKEKLSKLNTNSVKYENLEKDIRSTEGDIRALRTFFNTSPWFCFVTNIDGEYILENLDKELNAE